MKSVLISVFIGIVLSFVLKIMMDKQILDEKEKILKEKDIQIHVYEEKIKYLETANFNNIVETKTITKPTGEKIVSRRVDKTKQIIIEQQGFLYTGGLNLSDNEESEKEKITPPKIEYIFGFSNLQSLSKDITDYPVIIGVSYKPISIFLDIPLQRDFYKNLRLNVTMSF